MTAQTSEEADIVNALPIVEAVETTVNGVRVTVTVAATDLDGTIEQVLIDWGDGETRQEPWVEPFSTFHDYAIPLAHELSVRALDNDGGVSAMPRGAGSGPGGLAPLCRYRRANRVEPAPPEPVA